MARHKAYSKRDIVDIRTNGAGKRSDILKCLAHASDVRIRVGGRLCEYIRIPAGIFSGQPERGKAVGYNIRNHTEIFAGRRSEIQNRGQAGKHLFGFPASHAHIIIGFAGLFSREYTIACLVEREGAEALHVLDGALGLAQHGLDGRHLLVEAHAGVDDVLAELDDLAGELLHEVARGGQSAGKARGIKADSRHQGKYVHLFHHLYAETRKALRGDFAAGALVLRRRMQ